jgi:RNA polymerase sigma factor (TIGR02999 family)
MTDVTQILSQIEGGDQSAAEKLLPLVYDELRKLAVAKLSNEKPGQTLQATALVHDAYLRLVGPNGKSQKWDNRGHFFAAAAEAMRRILVDQARRKLTKRHGGAWQRIELLDDLYEGEHDDAETLAVHEQLDRLAEQSPRAVEVAKMRVFLEMTFVEIGDVLQISADTAESDWAYARAWLKRAWRQE